jgi:hypothetical protein
MITDMPQNRFGIEHSQYVALADFYNSAGETVEVIEIVELESRPGCKVLLYGRHAHELTLESLNATLQLRVSELDGRLICMFEGDARRHNDWGTISAVVYSFESRQQDSETIKRFLADKFGVMFSC